MSLHRRDFMKLFGISIASLYLNRSCIPSTPTVTCYTPAPIVTPTLPPTTAASARGRLRLYWLRFGELAEKSREDTENKLGNELITGHRAELDELVANGEISASAADLVQEAYAAAVFHVWRSSAPITCYLTSGPVYSPTSANVLVEQAAVLSQIAEQGTIDPDTLAKAQTALERDMSFYALTDEEVQALYERLRKENEQTGQPLPPFEELSLELTPEAQEATQFIVDLLTSK